MFFLGAGRCGSAFFQTVPFKFSRFILPYPIYLSFFSSFHPILHKHHTTSDVSAIGLTHMKPDYTKHKQAISSSNRRTTLRHWCTQVSHTILKQQCKSWNIPLKDIVSTFVQTVRFYIFTTCSSMWTSAFIKMKNHLQTLHQNYFRWYPQQQEHIHGTVMCVRWLNFKSAHGRIFCS